MHSNELFKYLQNSQFVWREERFWNFASQQIFNLVEIQLEQLQIRKIRQRKSIDRCDRIMRSKTINHSKH